MEKFDYNKEIWYGMTQNQLNCIYDIVCDNNLNEKLFDYIAECQMTYEDAEQLTFALISYPKGHTQRDFFKNGVYLFSA